jgi:hypothetical protein
MLLCGIGFGVFTLFAILFWGSFSSVLEQKSPLLRQYLWLGFPMAFFYVTSSVLAAYSANFKRIVVPSLLLDFSQKLSLPLLLIAVWQGWISLDIAVWGMVLHAAYGDLRGLYFT